MSEKAKTIWLVIGGIFGTGIIVGAMMYRVHDDAIQEMRREALSAGVAEYVNGEDGEPEFRWKVKEENDGQQQPEEREGQQAAAAMLKRMFAEAGLPVMDSVTHIVPLLVGDPVRAKKISDILLAEYGVYVQPINFPTVPRGTERLRFTPGPAHTEEMMRDLTEALVEIWDRLEIRMAA